LDAADRPAAARNARSGFGARRSEAERMRQIAT
jgi:hypothetical protein